MATFFRHVRAFFRQRPTGSWLVAIVCLKLFVMFAILRVFFFKPAMGGMSAEEKANTVSENIFRNE
ncbi:MAG: DUF4492 domain-containing protein [Alloprevotella sp.]|nr:DUF4492 domain-containing protein [Alloprevotella sp.]